MIKGVHGLFYTTGPEGARAFLHDKIRQPFTDVGDGWLTFNIAEGDIGCHPSDRPFHGVSFYCDDLGATMEEASKRGVAFSPVVEEDWGHVTTFELPEGGPVQIYQPKYDRNAKRHA